MLELDGCLPALAPRLRRVLVLRAGVGSARAHSRVRVARLLDVPVTRVGRLERRGLRLLRRAGRTTGCAGAPAAAGAGVDTGVGATAGGSTRFVSAGSPEDIAGGSATGGSSGDAGGADGSSAGGLDSSTLSPGTGEVLGESSERAPAVGAGGGDVTPLVLALILGLAVALGAMAIRRELR